MQEASANRVLISNSQEEIFNQEIKEHVPEYIVVLHAPSYSKKAIFLQHVLKAATLTEWRTVLSGFFFVF